MRPWLKSATAPAVRRISSQPTRSRSEVALDTADDVALHLAELGELLGADGGDIGLGLCPPAGLNGLDVAADGGLVDAEGLGDLGLGDLAGVEAGDLAAAGLDRGFLNRAAVTWRSPLPTVDERSGADAASQSPGLRPEIRGSGQGQWCRWR